MSSAAWFTGLAEYWSPYYRVTYIRDQGLINVNLIGHQQMQPRTAPFPAYALPHLLNRDAGGQPFSDVLIIGAGSGNDVSRALAWGAQHVDAVEIDPVIQRIGKRDHPDRPYDDPRVTVHLNDGRNFLKSTTRQYDLIIYALVDSLVLHSSYSNIRLESYLFTKQAMDDVRRRLKPGGLFVMYNYFRQGWIVFPPAERGARLLRQRGPGSQPAEPRHARRGREPRERLYDVHGRQQRRHPGRVRARPGISARRRRAARLERAQRLPRRRAAR